MRIVRLVTSWDYPPLMQQTPGGSGMWKGIRFTLEPVTECDYLIVLGMAHEDISVRCPPENVWCLLTEPPNEVFRDWHRANPVYHRVFTQDDSLHGDRYIHTQPALPWHVNRSYDELRAMSIPEKTESLSFLTSFKKAFSGHKERMDFLGNIRGKVPFDLVGTTNYYTRNEKETSDSEAVQKKLFSMGYTKVVEQKWDGLAPYRYSLVVENFRGKDYWSEKLTDALLAYTIPLYSGCSNIGDYFPAEAVIPIDIHDPHIADTIRGILESDQWEKRLKAVGEARNKILEQYQLFPFLTSHIQAWERQYPKKQRTVDTITIPNEKTAGKEMVRRLRRMMRMIGI